MQRYLVLDVLRGLTIALMILVNTPGSWSHVYAPLLHAKWHGVTPTDFIFPFFVFIVGSAMYFAFKKTNFTLDAQTARKIVKRGLLIFLIGLGLNAYPFVGSIDDLRIMGVLQRIGLVYICAAFIVLTCKRNTIFIISGALLIGYSLLMLTVGSDNAYALEGNLVRQVDILLFSEQHLYGGFGLAFDPEGLLSSIPAIVTALFGFEVTRQLTQLPDNNSIIKMLIKVGLVAVATGCMLHFVVPINKALWTASYVLVTGGATCLLLALFVYLIEMKNLTKLAEPCMVYGTNPLFIYVLSWVWVATYSLINVGDVNFGQWLYEMLSVPFSPKFASFAYAFLHVCLFWLISRELYKRKIFIKI